MRSSLLLTGALAASILAAPIVPKAAAPACATGVHIFAARGSTEPQGEGPLQAISTAIEAGVPGSDDFAVVYPADLDDYTSSVAEGVTNLVAELEAYVNQCPTTKIALIGYSQGAQVIGDALGGGSFSATPTISKQYAKNIIAAVQFGDPAFVVGKSYDFGNATQDGLFPRQNDAALDSYASILASYCADDDLVCGGGFSIAVHEAEVPTYGAAAAAFVISKAK